MTLIFHSLQNLMTYEDGKLKLKSTPVTPGYKPQDLERDVVNGELVQVRAKMLSHPLHLFKYALHGLTFDC